MDSHLVFACKCWNKYKARKNANTGIPAGYASGMKDFTCNVPVFLPPTTVGWCPHCSRDLLRNLNKSFAVYSRYLNEIFLNILQVHVFE
jgi:hypothetical protein